MYQEDPHNTTPSQVLPAVPAQTVAAAIDRRRPRDSQGKACAVPDDTVLLTAAEVYLADDRIAGLREMDRGTAYDGLYALTNAAIALENQRIRDGQLVGEKLSAIGGLAPVQVARLIGRLHTLVRLAPSTQSNTSADADALAVYVDDPTSARYGTYVVSVDATEQLIRRYWPGVNLPALKETYKALHSEAPRVTRGENKDLVPCRNGIVDYNGGDPKFIEFSPEYVFLAKLDVDWNPDAQNTVIHNDADGTDWDVESWMRDFYTSPNPFTEEMMVDEAMSELLWQLVGAAVRPYVSWHKCAFFYSAQGNNGKGTLVSLMRNMLGAGNYASIPLADFGKDHLLEPLTRANAVLVDENDVGTFVEKGGNFKAVVTNDVITFNRKYKEAISHQHFGFMVQCLNDPPVFKDKSESVYRRQLFVPFIKSFTGAERQYIKNDYLKRPEVLEYVLKRVLTGSLTEPYYELSEPDLVKAALNEFKSTNDPVRAFWEEISNELVWDLNPFTFIYDLYKAWMARYMPNSKAIGRNKFITELVALIRADETSQWECADQTAPHRPSSMMSAPEHLIAEYNLPEWGNPTVPLSDPNYRDRRSTIPGDRMKPSYRGFKRREISLPAVDLDRPAALGSSDTGLPAPAAKPKQAARPPAPAVWPPAGADELLNSPYDLDTPAGGDAA